MNIFESGGKLSAGDSFKPWATADGQRWASDERQDVQTEAPVAGKNADSKAVGNLVTGQSMSTNQRVTAQRMPPGLLFIYRK